MPKVQVKWSGNRYQVDADLNSDPMTFKAQLYALTGVVPERQKVVFKGRTLKDESWVGFNLEDGSLLMLLGTIGPIPQAPTAAEMEVDSDVVKAEKKVIMPPGLDNLGNTCYMNATVQTLRTIPELSTALDLYSAPADAQLSDHRRISVGMKTLFDQMKKSEKDKKTYSPLIFLLTLQKCFPQLATKTPQGQNQQQDANECFCEIMNCLKAELRLQDGIMFSKYIEGMHEVTLKNLSNESETSVSYNSFTQLSCYLSQEVKYMQLGINKTTETIKKRSEISNEDADFEKKTLISRLPAYLSVQMVRFFYKEKEQVNAKILKDVKFPTTFDAFELCTPALKEKLDPQRKAFKEYEDKAVEVLQKSKLNDEKKEENEVEKKYAPFSFPDDPGSNNSGFYELQGIVTHKGRSSNSGHYVGWVKTSQNKWVMCDDDETQVVAEEDVLKLSGGGDWHCAYILLYGPRRLPLSD